MDNRWRFLYHMATELWGRMGEARAGKGKTGTSDGGRGEANPPARAKGAKWSERE